MMSSLWLSDLSHYLSSCWAQRVKLNSSHLLLLYYGDRGLYISVLQSHYVSCDGPLFHSSLMCCAATNTNANESDLNKQEWYNNRRGDNQQMRKRSLNTVKWRKVSYQAHWPLNFRLEYFYSWCHQIETGAAAVTEWRGSERGPLKWSTRSIRPHWGVCWYFSCTSLLWSGFYLVCLNRHGRAWALPPPAVFDLLAYQPVSLRLSAEEGGASNLPAIAHNRCTTLLCGLMCHFICLACCSLVCVVERLESFCTAEAPLASSSLQCVAFFLCL